MKKVTKLKLKDFYRDISAALKSTKKGKEAPIWFNENVGLCSHLLDWGEYVGLNKKERTAFFKEMVRGFVAAGLAKDYPFNRGDVLDYLEERGHYENKERLKWIRDHTE